MSDEDKPRYLQTRNLAFIRDKDEYEKRFFEDVEFFMDQSKGCGEVTTELIREHIGNAVWPMSVGALMRKAVKKFDLIKKGYTVSKNGNAIAIWVKRDWQPPPLQLLPKPSEEDQTK